MQVAELSCLKFKRKGNVSSKFDKQERTSQGLYFDASLIKIGLKTRIMKKVTGFENIQNGMDAAIL